MIIPAMRSKPHSLLALLSLGCSSAATSPDASVAATDVPTAATDVSRPDDAPAGCVPDRAAWNSEVRALVARQCGTCHGASPQFGSPYSLLEYDANLTGAVGSRRAVS